MRDGYRGSIVYSWLQKGFFLRCIIIAFSIESTWCHTYLFFEFGDDLSGEIVFGVMVIVLVVVLFVEAESERVGGFIIGVERVDEVLTPARTVSSSA